VDILLIETAQDLLQAKIATIGVLDAMRKAGKRLPVQVQVTLQESGTLLLGTEIGAALTAFEPYDVDAIGLNCATGPAEMNDAVRYLGSTPPKKSVYCRTPACRRMRAATRSISSASRIWRSTTNTS
jgi:5-methyltetrahydrofolate--homocysteine methyltransferase